MTKYYFFVLWLFLGGLFALSGQETSKPIIVIDPGHGGKDYGAAGTRGVREKDVVIRIVKEILRLNREVFRHPLEIYCTRYNDTLISLKDRTRLAKNLQADVFISLHCNKGTKQTVKGLEVYVLDTEGPFFESSIWMAHKFHLQLTQKLGLQGRGIKFGDFQVLRETRNHCASVLLELGFLSNKKDEEFNSKESSISAYALAIIEILLKTEI